MISMEGDEGEECDDDGCEDERKEKFKGIVVFLFILVFFVD